jgi:hypothetical protein
MSADAAGFLAIDRGDHQEAVNIFQRSLRKGKDPTAYYGFGLAHFLLEDYATARWAFHKTLELDPRHAEAIRHLAMMETPDAGAGKAASPPPPLEGRFRAGTGCLEVHRGEWKRLFIKGINLGIGLPGSFPGEYAVKKGTYRKWFGQISAIGINALRVYTLHPPSFYEALDEWNRSGKALYLFQGIWTEPPAEDDYSGEGYLSYVRGNIRDAIDAVHGNMVLSPRPGYPDGKYSVDVSWCTAGFLFGREWEPCSVRRFNESREGGRGAYEGRFLTIAEGTPFEVLLTEVCDYIQRHEYDRYGKSRPCSVVNWPTLDPLDHPSESTHEEELALQGQRVKAGVCNENEDMVSLDVSKIRPVSGAGFFATYHAYPYYPDFMNNDDPSDKTPYLTYLRSLKSHHGDQPVLIAEFGVPSSREHAHWQRNGWNHGGHDEAEQGRINALQMKAVHDAGMAGGVLFSWFDEWFKKNWLFQPYALPPERKPFWFNHQDPEENYGLLAAYPGYPGKKVTLSGNPSEWGEAAVLYRKKAGPPGFRFDDGGDDARTLLGMRMQHDEGFVYLLLETKGAVDFDKASYVIGINTSSPDSGEYLVPFDTRARSPIGLHFLVHLAGMRNSRILVTRPYDRFLNAGKGEIAPGRSDQGAWVVLLSRTNTRRISKDGKRIYPSHVRSMSSLRHGTLDGKRPDFDSLSDFHVAGNRVEIRIPWCLLNFTDPSSRNVLWMRGAEKSRATEGIRAIALSYSPRNGSTEARKAGGRTNITDSLPQRLVDENVTLYSWDPWDTPVYHMYLKKSYYMYKEALSGIPEAP